MTPSHSPSELGQYFQLFDSLQREASTLDEDRESLQAAQRSYKLEAEELEETKAAVVKNVAFIKTQKDRIQLVSHHWFYGTTALQPQLWLRGGCQGKIDRARVKLEKAENEHPTLVDFERTQQQKEAAANEVLRKREAAFGRAADADKEAKRMKEELVLLNPTFALNKLLKDDAELQRKIGQHKQRSALLENIGSLLHDATRCAVNVESHIKRAEKKDEEAERLARAGLTLSLPSSGSTITTMLDDGGKEVITEGSSSSPYRDYKRFDAQGNVILTNRPCPSGCGYVITFHPTHCCSACANPQLRGGCHGRRCEGISLASQEGAVELWNKMQRQRQAHEKRLGQLRHQAKRELLDANRELQKGFNTLRTATMKLSGGQGSSADDSSAWMPPAGSCCSGSCTCCPVSTMCRQVRAQAHQLQLAVKDQEFDARQQRQVEDQEGRRLNLEITKTKSLVVEEKDSIFASLRSSSEIGNDDDYTFDDSWERPPAMSPNYIPDHIPVAPATPQRFERPPATSPNYVPMVEASLINDI